MVVYLRAVICINFLFCWLVHDGLGQSGGNIEIPLATKIKIRRLIYNSKLKIQTNYDGVFPKRSLLVPEELENVYQQYPYGVSSLLLTIVEGARPEDSHAAYCYAIALNSNPMVPVLDASSFAKGEYDSIINIEQLTKDASLLGINVDKERILIPENRKETCRTIYIDHLRVVCSDLEKLDKTKAEGSKNSDEVSER